MKSWYLATRVAVMRTAHPARRTGPASSDAPQPSTAGAGQVAVEVRPESFMTSRGAALVLLEQPRQISRTPAPMARSAVCPYRGCRRGDRLQLLPDQGGPLLHRPAGLRGGTPVRDPRAQAWACMERSSTTPAGRSSPDAQHAARPPGPRPGRAGAHAARRGIEPLRRQGPAGSLRAGRTYGGVRSRFSSSSCWRVARQLRA